MKNYLVLYYSKTGNSHFIAQKLADELGGDFQKIVPSINNTLFLILLSLMKARIPINISKEIIEAYSDIVIIGPIWAGQFISPLRTALKICRSASKNIHFAVTCETKDEDKNKKFGYAKVLREAEIAGGTFVKTTEAFSTALVNNAHTKGSVKLSEKIKITDENFHGAIESRLSAFALKIKCNGKGN